MLFCRPQTSETRRAQWPRCPNEVAQAQPTPTIRASRAWASKKRGRQRLAPPRAQQTWPDSRHQ
eukprot:scaffold196724_cov18-Tisochrysis_lutea.AAC.2